MKPLTDACVPSCVPSYARPREGPREQPQARAHAPACPRCDKNELNLAETLSELNLAETFSERTSFEMRIVEEKVEEKQQKSGGKTETESTRKVEQ